jgi:hypothetical protein
LRHSKGNVKKAAATCRNMAAFRRREGWPLAIKPSQVDRHALRGGLHWLLEDRHGRALFVYNFDKFDPLTAAAADAKADVRVDERAGDSGGGCSNFSSCSGINSGGSSGVDSSSSKCEGEGEGGSRHGTATVKAYHMMAMYLMEVGTKQQKL